MKDVRFLFLIPLLLGILACAKVSDDLTSDAPATSQTESTTLALPSAESPTGAASTPLVQEANKQEILVMWGRREQIEGECLLWLIEPAIQELQEPVIGKPWCHYEVINVDGKDRLVTFPPYSPTLREDGSEITIYGIMNAQMLSIEKTWSLKDIRLTATPQWARNGNIYFSGIAADGVEQIYRLDSDTGAIWPYIDSSEGFATAPIISPNGRYLAYQMWENHRSRDDCGQQTCFLNFYHLWDIENDRSFALQPVIEPLISGESYYIHCDLTWSPTGEFVAFRVGCGLQDPGSVVIFNVTNNEIGAVINAPADAQAPTIYKWVSENELILSGAMLSPVDGTLHNGYMVHSTKTQTLEELSQLPRRNRYDSDLVYFSDWTTDGSYALGHTPVPGEERNVELVIVNTTNGDTAYISTPDEYVDNLLWSPSAQWTVYRSYNWDTQNTSSRLNILDRTGNVIVDSGMMNIVLPQFSWLTLP